MKDDLCEAEVKRNLVLAEVGKALTLPLAVLNRSCHFKKEWYKIQNKWHGRINKEYQREYQQRPEVKERTRKHRQCPEVKKKMREYQRRPDVKKRMREYQIIYRQRPEVKERMRKYQRERYKKMKEEMK